MDNKEKLYNALSEEYDLGTFEQFSADLDNEEKRRKLYDATSDDYDYGDYESFSAQLGYKEPFKMAEPFDMNKANEESLAGLTAPQQQDYVPSPSTDSQYEGQAPVVEQAPRRGFKAGMQESWKGLKAGTQFAYGEVVNGIFGSSQDDANALYELNEMLRQGKDVASEVEGAWTDAGREIRTGALEFLPGWAIKGLKDRVYKEAEHQKILDDIREVLGETNGDVAKARQILEERAMDLSHGDRVKLDAQRQFGNIRETEGFGAWLGENTVQMIPSASALIVGALTKSPAAARAIGMIGMGGMTAATSGSSMYEAREAGASDLETHKVGVVDGAIEYITEKLPFDNYTNWMVGKTKGKVATEVARALRSKNSPVRAEMEELLTMANKELGGKLFSKKNAAAYIADMVAEGASEFTAEASQTMTRLMYDNPDLFPLLGEALANGWQGALAGFFMGGVLGGASKTMEHHQNRERRQKQGYVDVGLVNFGTAENPDNDIVEVISVSEDTDLAQVLRDGAIINVNKNAIGQQYRYSYEAFEAGRMRVLESEALDNEFVTQGMIQAADSREATAEQNLVEALRASGMADDEIMTLLDDADADKIRMFESPDIENAYNIYRDARHRARELRRTSARQAQSALNLKKLSIEENAGQFWRDNQTEDANGNPIFNPTVETGLMQDGTRVYVLSDVNDQGECAAVTENGEHKIIKADMLQDGTQVFTLDEYLQSLVDADKVQQEQTRMVEQTQDRMTQARQAAQPGTQINLGTEEDPVIGSIVEQGPDGVIVQSEAGASQLTWDEYANAMHIGAPALTDNETAGVEAAEILSAESAYNNEVAQTESEAKEVADESGAALQEFEQADPLPRDAEGNVDETTLWNDSPARWAEWNDEQRQDGGANSVQAIDAAVAKLSATIAEQQAAYGAMPVGKERNAVEQEIASLQKRLAELLNVQQRYVAPVAEEVTETAAEAPAAEVAEEPAVEAANPVRETLTQLYNDPELSESEIEAFINANVQESQKALDKHLDKAPKMGTDMAKYKADRAKHQAKTAELEKQRDFWREVQSYIEMPDVTEMDMEPQNALEFTANELTRKDGVKLQRDSFTRHTGYGSEAGNFLSMLRTKQNGGLTLEEAGERLMEMDRENGTGFFDQSDPNAGLNAILEVIGGARTSGDVSGYIKANREQLAREEMAAARNAMMEEITQEDTAPAENIIDNVESDLPEDIFMRAIDETEAIGGAATVKGRAEAWEKRLGIKVNLIDSVDQITDKAARTAIESGTKVSGWFNAENGQVYIYVPNTQGSADVDATMIHEIIAHKGLRGYLGKKGFDALCDVVWSAMNPETKAKYLTYANVLTKARLAEYNANPEAFEPTAKERRAAADEFIARRSESINADKNAWQKMIDSVKRFINKLTGNYSLADQLDELLEASLARYETIAKMDLQGVVEEGQTYGGIINAETGAKIDASSDIQAEGNVSFRGKDGSLVGMHNISEDKLRKAIKQGGLANPSTAVVNIDEYSLEGYGEISLIMPSSLVNPETGDNAGTYSGDAWTPTYPPISRKVNDRGWKVIKDRIRAAVGEESALYSDIVHGVDNYLDDNHRSKMEFVFLKEKGIEPEIKYKGAEGLVGTRNLEAILGVEGLRDGWESYEKYKAASPMSKRSFNMWVDSGGDKTAHRELKEMLKKEPKLADVLKLNEDLPFSRFDSFTYHIWKTERDAGRVDTYDTMAAASSYVDANNLRAEFEQWLESLMEQAGAREVFFAGFTRDGDRIYKDNTLENVSRHMRMQGRTNAYDDKGLSATKSVLLERFESLSQIRRNRGRLADERTYNKAYDELKDRLYNIISQLSDMETISSNPFINLDYAESRLQDALTKRNPVAYLNKEYGYSIDPKGEYASELKSFIKDVQKMPAKYFETKFERPVYLNEFAAAVMPATTGEDIKQAISEAGLPIYEYDSSVEGARHEATLKATDDNDVRFRIIGEEGAANLDAAEEASVRLDNLTAAREMEAAGKDAKAIKLATGWERGTDNLWRYEVPDDFDLTELENRLQENLNDGMSKAWGIVYPSDLGDLINEYPDFNVDIMVWVGDEFENTGEYSPATEGDENTFGRSASIEVRAKTVADIKSVLVHEIQHVIQEKEGFAEGGNAFGLKDKLSAELDKRVERIKELRAEGRDADADELMSMSKGLAEAVINNEDDAYGNYRKLAGEVEARNASARLGMTMQERRETLLSETEDVAPEDQIILMEGLSDVSNATRTLDSTSETPTIGRSDIAKMDKAYMDAVEAGDMVTAQRMVIEAAKLAMPNTKVPGIVYHGTRAKDGEQPYNTITAGHFTDDYGFAEYYANASGEGFVYNTFVNIERPLIYDFKGQNSDYAVDENGERITTFSIIERARKDGKYDGVILKNVDEYGAGVEEEDGEYPGTITDIIPLSPSQIKSADPVIYDDNGNVIPLSQRFNPENADIRFRVANENQAIFVSNAAKAVEGIKQEKATPEQWLKMIEKNGGLKAGEDKWMGLSDWLKASDKRTLTKAEVLDFINENMIIIEEQHYSEDENALDGKRQEIKEALQGFFDEYVAESEDMNDDMFMKTHYDYAIQKLADELGYTAFNAPFINNNALVELDFYEDDLDTLHELNNKLGLEKYDGTRDINDTRLSYTTEGLTDKHEIALVVPTIESWNESDDIHFGDAGDGRAVAWIRFGDAMKLLGTTEVDGKKKFNWAKVLVIDEIQSKRHQEGREQGYSMTKEEYQKRLDSLETEAGDRLKRRTELLRTLKEKYGEDFRAYLKLENTAYVPNESVMSPVEVQEWYETSQEEINDAIDALKKEKRSGIPDAPFDKNWHELAMKRMLRYAAENGYDVIAWTKGAQQNQRYGLSKVVDEIYVASDFASTKSEESSFRMILKNGNDNHVGVNKKTGVVTFYNENPQAIGKPLSDLLGKEMADKILAAKDYQTFRGVDFELSEGMKGFYDKMLPAFMNKYGKKWGVKVEDINLPGLANGLTMHSVPVTEEMKASVMEGQVMFRVRGENESAVDFCLTCADDIRAKYRIDAEMRVAEVNEKNAKILGYKDGVITDQAIYLPEYNMIIIFAHEDWENGLDIECAIFHEIIHKYEDPAVGEWLWNHSDGIQHLADLKRSIIEGYPEDEFSNEDRFNEMLCDSLSIAMTSGTAQAFYNSLPEEHKVTVDNILNEIRYDRERESTERVRRSAGESSIGESGDESISGKKGPEAGGQSGIQETNRETAEGGAGRSYQESEMAEADSVSETSGESESQAQEADSEGLSFRVTDITPEVRAEMNTISAIALVNGTYLKAPNGADTNLTPEQWALVRTNNFLRWFGDWINDPENASKVVDENGEPMVVYHETDWDALSEPNGGAVFKMGESDAFYFSNTPSRQGFEYGENRFDFFLNIRKPRILRTEYYVGRGVMSGRYWSIDGVINIFEDKIIFTTFSPSQIKSATDNTGEFSNENGDIRFRMMDSNGNTLTPDQEAFFGNSKAVDKDGNLLVLYHGTPRAGFTEFTSGWFTTSMEDAISYSGDRKGRMFDPNEKYEAETFTAGDYRLGYMTFDSEEDRAAFLAEHPEAENAVSEAEFDRMTLQADEEYDDLIAKKPELQKIWKAYREYERERFVDTTIADLLANPEAYTEDDLRRAMLAYDSNANFDSLDDMDAAERKDALVSALRNAVEQTEGGIADMKVATRVPRNGEGLKHNDLGNRTYEVYANIEKPYEIDAAGRSSEFESGDVYKAVDEALNNPEYDGVIIRNWRVGRYQQLGDVVVPKNGSQVQLVSNESPAIEASEDAISFRIVTDEQTLNKLNNEPTIKVYRAMQLIDGKLYPPMSAKVDGQLREPIELGQWEEAEERPDLADNKGYFKLDKGNKTSIKARYNPYFHTSPTPLNDQFSSAQSRPELVTVEVEIPESELTSGYKAEKAKDSVGEKEWKAGVVQSKLSGTRTVILSRWDKPIRIVPDSEVADVIVKMFEGRDIVMPSNVVTPSLRAELESRGVPFVETDNQGKPKTKEEVFAKDYFQLIDDMFSGKKNLAEKYQMRYFDLAETPDFYKSIGIIGDKFTVKYGTISAHFGKDKDHRMTEEAWKELPYALANPIFITQYGNKSNKYRIYTSIKLGDRFVIAGVDVIRSNQGKNKPMIEINSIRTVFAAKRIGDDEKLICYNEQITPEQEALLNGRNFRQYPTIQELSESKDSDNIDTSNDLDENISYRITGTPTEQVVAEGVLLSPADMARVAGRIFSVLPEEARREVTASLNGNILGLQDAIMQIPARLAMKQDWDEQDMAVAEAIAAEMDRITPDKTRPFSTYEGLWMLYDALTPASSLNLMDQASRAIVKRNLGVDEATLERIKKDADDVRFRATETAEVDALVGAYNQSSSFWKNRLYEVFVDQYDSVDGLVKSIEESTGMKAKSFEDVVSALNQMPAKSGAKTTQMVRKYIIPMWDAIKELVTKYDLTEAKIARYTKLKHGLERNEEFPRRDARAFYRAAFEKKIASINADKSLSEAEKDALKKKAQDDLDFHFASIESGSDAKFQEFREKDYSGIMAMYEDSYDNLADAEEAAKAEVESFEDGKENEIKELWKRINALNKATLKVQYETGQIGKAAYESLKEQFKYYVPLRGFEKETAEDQFSYYAREFSSFEAAVLKAKGRKTEAESPFGHMGAMMASAIVAGEKNEAKLALYYFALNRKDNGLLTIKDVWYIKREDSDAWELSLPPVKGEGESVADYGQRMDAWEDRMKTLQGEGKAKKGKQNLNLADIVHIDDSSEREHYIRVQVAGQEKWMIINGNPRAAQAINGLLNLESDPYFNKFFGKVMRELAQLSTSYNPEFWMTNLERDFMTTFATVVISEDAEYRKAFFKNYKEAWKVVKMLPKLKDGTLGDTGLEGILKEAVAGGLQTGFSHIKANEVWDKEMEQHFQDLDAGKAKQAIRSTFDKLQNLSESMELVSRFAVYMTSRQMGKSVAKAVADGKEVTANFNRKGSGRAISFEEAKKITTRSGKTFREEYGEIRGAIAEALIVAVSRFAEFGRKYILFFNASVQGLDKWFRLARRNKGNARKLAAYFGSQFALGFIMSLLHGMLDDDDEYQENVSDYDRRNNFMIGGNGYYIKVALPHDVRTFYGMGDIFYNYVSGNYKHHSVKEAAKTVAKQAGSLLPVNPFNGWSEFVPAFIKPIIEAGAPFNAFGIEGTNENFAGMPIRKETPWLTDEDLERTPKYTLAGDYTWDWLVNVSEALNRVTGGTYKEAGKIDIDPARIQHYIEGWTGGVGRTTGNFATFISQLIGEEEWKAANTPFLNKILTITDERSQNRLSNDQFYHYSDVGEAALSRAKAYEKDGEMELLAKEVKSDEYKIGFIYTDKKKERQYKKTEEMYRKQLKEAKDEAEEKRIKELRDANRKRFLKELEDLDLL